MPGFYADGEYDLAGFAVGSVHKEKVIDGSKIIEGDLVVGFKSSGVHSNGFSLVRKVIEKVGASLDDKVAWSDESLGLTLLTPTRLYVREVMALLETVNVKVRKNYNRLFSSMIAGMILLDAHMQGLVHITGGGFPENIPRVVPKGLGTRLFLGSWEVPPLFQWLQENGKIIDSEMFLTFNMGIGMIAIMSKEDAETALSAGLGAGIIGEIVTGNGVEII